MKRKIYPLKHSVSQVTAKNRTYLINNLINNLIILFFIFFTIALDSQQMHLNIEAQGVSNEWIFDKFLFSVSETCKHRNVCCLNKRIIIMKQ